MSQLAGKVWREHGALEYRECVGEDLKVKMGVSFKKLAKPKPGETVVFSWIVYKSRAHRDRVNAKVMKDPRLASMMDPKAMPFDHKRMSYVTQASLPAFESRAGRRKTRTVIFANAGKSPGF